MFKLEAQIDNGAMLAHSKFLQPALEAGPGDHLARLSDPMVYSGSVATSCRSPAFLHEQVAERKTRTGRNPRSI
ncbi:hypothetical protein WMO79_09145 [Micrococcaceae bacterium Sec7.4]